MPPFGQPATGLRGRWRAAGSHPPTSGRSTDLEPGNWVFDRGEPRPIDFDEFGLGYFLFDLMGVLWSHAGWDDYPVYRSTLLDGYEAIRPLPEGCRADADVFVAANILAWLNHGLGQGTADVRAGLLK